MQARRLITVLGHTAGGKTSFAVALAHRLGGEIISADSRQVYRGMDIGTGKDLSEYRVDGEELPHHLIDIAEAGSEYNVFSFKKDFIAAYMDITGRGKTALMCGGSGMYLESVLRNYKMLYVPEDEELRTVLESKSNEELEAILKGYGPLHNQTDTENRKRLIRAIEIAMYQGAVPDDSQIAGLDTSLVLGIRYERVNRRKRISERLKQRLEAGMIDEVEGLLRQGVSPERLEYYGLEYKFISRYLRKDLAYDDMVAGLNTAIHQFAKRQMTYFRGMERRGISIHWLQGERPQEEKLEEALALIGAGEQTI
ncbi:MAG: tRNA (adenosine(37)-N6)-dimethylallyltransferase MiaA [Bacteroidetes bacterium]|nr:MAG: tRNA (adenosine(37)-N6)-dimethylallyltransferase MiaA [Bacteroidota bacterium]